MLRVGHYVFKRAETSDEFEQIHRLNHKTFVQEIPQHADTGAGSLIDKFHNKNAYLIVLKGNRVVGMLSAHGQPPFSIADRLSEPNILHQPGICPLEVRLLAIEPGERNSTLFFGLIHTLYQYARANGYTHLFISGIEERLGMYRRIGFRTLGPAVGTGKATFVPMVLDLDAIPLKMQRVKQLWESHMERVPARGTVEPPPAVGLPPSGGERLKPGLLVGIGDAVCLLPGPVTTSAAVQKAFQQPPIYHRGPEFIRRFMAVRQMLRELVNCKDVAIL